MTAPPAKALFYPAWVSCSGRRSLCWGPPCDTPSEARRIGRAEIASGNATLAFVVRFSGGEKTPMPSYTSPESAKKIVLHWEALWAATEPPEE